MTETRHLMWWPRENSRLEEPVLSETCLALYQLLIRPSCNIRFFSFQTTFERKIGRSVCRIRSWLRFYDCRLRSSRNCPYFLASSRRCKLEEAKLYTTHRNITNLAIDDQCANVTPPTMLMKHIDFILYACKFKRGSYFSRKIFFFLRKYFRQSRGRKKKRRLEKKDTDQREEQRWISRFESKINFRESLRDIDYPILAVNLFDPFSAERP